MAELLRMEGITKQFGAVYANKDINLSIEEGEIHTLLGENGAGKSTLMNILIGLYQPTSGTIWLKGKKVKIDSPKTAVKLGIGMVHQHFMLVENMTVYENVAVGFEDETGLRLDKRKIIEKINELAQRLRFDIDPLAMVCDLTVGEKQRIEILKTIYRHSKIIILDEPTAVLTPQEVEVLFEIIEILKAQGTSIVMITHKLKECLEIADRISVMRDGRMISTNMENRDLTPQILADLMVGRNVPLNVTQRSEVISPEIAVRVENLNYTVNGKKVLDNIGFYIAKGEIVGVAGVDGNGQRELAECISGMRKLTGGSVTIKGKPVTGVIADPSFLGFIPEDRQKTGLVMDFTIADNLIIKDYYNEPFAEKNILNYKTIKKHARKMIKKYHVKTPSEDVRVRNLSGGNQQKVVIARELDPEPVLDLVAHPTRGLDLGAVDNVLDILMKERNRGAAVLFISAELQEVMALSDRIIVLFNGEIMGELDGATADQKVIGQMMLGQVPEVL